ncbi:TPA: HlyD family efflux transporter periplasmic adaptor subunit [Enterococcus faecalis]
MKIYNKDELQNSRLFFDTEPINYLKLLCYFLLIVVFGGIFSLKYIPKNYIVKANGTIEANDKLYITPLTNADIVKINFQEGDRVKKGDLLLSLSLGTEGVQEKEIDIQIQEAKEKIAIFNKFEQSLNEKNNLLKNEGAEQEYYGKIEYYLSQVADDEKKNDSSNKELDNYSKELNNLKSDLKDIENSEYDKYSKEYARKNQDLEIKKKKKLELENQISIIKNEKDINTSSDEKENSLNVENLNSEIETIDEEIKNLLRGLEDSTEEYETSLNEKLKTKNDEIRNKEQEIISLKNQENSQAISINQQLTSELGAARTQNDEKIQELQSQRNIKSSDSKMLSLTANKDGVIHYMTPIKVGLGLQAFQPIAQIDNGKNSDLIVECYISAQDRSKIDIGNISKIALSGVNQTKYGLLQGEVISIGAGTVSQQSMNENSELLYQVIINLKTSSLGYGKDYIKAVASMPVVANIVYEKENYFDWVLEQLNFLNLK